MTRKRAPAKVASASRRSRVTPGLSSTIASRLPDSRLNSVDLPTLGRPMIATTGRSRSFPLGSSVSGIWGSVTYKR